MYSMVLMAALTTGADLPDFGRRGGCCGCYGGYGWGGCYGCYGGGGWGGGYGGWGGYGRWGGGYGGWGMGMGGWGGMGYVSAPAAPYYVTPVYASNTLPSSTTATRSMYYKPYEESANKRATITVHLPANAQLIVDGKATRSTSATRRFTSPPLQPGKSYHYTLEARIEGETVTQRVDVSAGDQRNITLTLPRTNEAAEGKRTPATPAEDNGVPERRTQVNRR
jgi:uncharacterized protein (TIGR03000 family)